MASSPSPTPSSPNPATPLSPTVAPAQDNDDNYDDKETHRVRTLRKRRLDSNSSPSVHLMQQAERSLPQEKTFRRKIKTQRNRTTLQKCMSQKQQENRILNNFLGDHKSTPSSSSSEEEEEELKRQRQRRSLSRLRKSNRIIPGTFTTIETTSIPSGIQTPKKSTSQLIISKGQELGPIKLEKHDESLRVSIPEAQCPSPVHLRWEGQSCQLIEEISSYFEAGKFVDVTLICDGPEGEEDQRIEIGAHKIILASYSDYFRRILEETPLKHPMMFLKGFCKWELETLLEFMYKGEVNIGSNQVDLLLRTAATLQIRGIAECLERMLSGPNGNLIGKEVDCGRVIGEGKSPPAHSCHNNDDVKDEEESRGSPGLLNLSISGGWGKGDVRCSGSTSSTEEPGRNGPQTARAHRPGFPIHQPHHPPLTQQTASANSPPFPRRKQARPRRRSGDFVAQDLRLTPPAPMDYFSYFGNGPPFRALNLGGGSKNGHIEDDEEETVLDFTISSGSQAKSCGKPLEGVEIGMMNQCAKNWHFPALGHTHFSPPLPLPHRHATPPTTGMEFEVMSPRDQESVSPPENIRIRQGEKKRPKARIVSNLNGNVAGFLSGSPPSPSFFMNFNSMGNVFAPPPHHHNSDSESNNADPCSTPPTVQSPAAFSSAAPQNNSSGTKKQRNGDTLNGGSQAWQGLPLGPAPIFGRHRAQHSAPRGGPPRAWSNADLTEALHNVWNKKMTTSQASRIFGIPYNSLLMYVRGKYGKSLHLDVLKKGVDMAMENNAAAAAAAAAKGTNAKLKCQQPRAGRMSTSPASSPSSNNATPPHNNNNTIGSKGSKGKTGTNSPPGGTHPSINLSSILGQGLTGAGSPEPMRLGRHHSPESNNSVGELIPPGFNPFGMGGIFGDYPPPFPFPTVAAANAALSHILPPHHPHNLLTNSQRRVNHHNGPTEK